MNDTGALARTSRLERILALAPGDALERAYLFEPLERGGTSFSLVFVMKACADDRLEMIALGGRIGVPGEAGWDFVRRARFPRTTLADVLEEFIERCGMEGASYREIDLAGDGPEAGLAGLSQLLASPDVPEVASDSVDPS
ncbi:MAG: hypothetical protein ACREMK_07250 [Gemmatimonadota bacterium]